MLSLSRRMVTSFLLCMVLLLPTNLHVFAQGSNAHWAAKTIEKWVEHGLLTEHVDPDQRLERLDFVVLINHILGLTEEGSAQFIDVDANSVEGKAVRVAIAAGYMKGYPDGSFRGSQPVTRQEVAVILTRIFNVTNMAGTVAFNDYKNLAAWSKLSVNALAAEGYIKGYADGTFRPDKQVTLAELITIIDNIADVIIIKPGVYENLQARSVLIAASDVTITSSEIERNVYISKGVAENQIAIRESRIGGHLFSNIGKDGIDLEGTTFGEEGPEQPAATPEPTVEPTVTPPPAGGPGTGENNSEFTVRFDLNYEGATSLKPVTVAAGDYIKVEDKPEVPVREGYRFAGWHTVKEPKLVNGVSEQEWLFGEKYMNWDGITLPDDKSTMPVTQNMVLYARWVEPTEISTVEQLLSIKDDLYGWYVLSNDIDLTSLHHWEPVGQYDHTYEFAVEEWWQLAFRGQFDGNGFAIKGLSLTEPKNIAALFGAVADARIHDLTLLDYNIDVAISHTYAYIAPLVGVAKGDKTEMINVHTDGVLNVEFNNDQSDGSFAVVSGLVAGNWSGVVDSATVRGDIRLNSKHKNGGEVYVGGLVGEGYGVTVNSSVEANITVNTFAQGPLAADEQDLRLDIFVGGLHAASTFIMNSVAAGDITIVSDKQAGSMSVNAGGISGSGRYGFIENSLSQANLVIQGGQNIYAGGIQGSFHPTYGMIGYLSGIKRFEVYNSINAGTISINTATEEAVHLGAIIGHIPQFLELWGGQQVEGLYRSEHNVYWNGFNEQEQHSYTDLNATIVGYDAIEELQGYALISQLGFDQWLYTDNQLPAPTVRENWDLNSVRESDDDQPSSPGVEEEVDYAVIAGEYFASLAPYGELQLILNIDQTYELSGVLGESRGSYSATESSITLVNSQDDNAVTYAIRNQEILVPVYDGMFTVNLVKQDL